MKTMQEPKQSKQKIPLFHGMTATRDYYLVIPPPHPDETEGGIAIAGTAKIDTYHYGRVLSAGPDIKDGDKHVGMILMFPFEMARKVHLDQLRSEREGTFIYQVVADVVNAVITDDIAKQYGMRLPPDHRTFAP